MTRYYAVVLDGANALFASFATADKAEAYDMARTIEGYESRSAGEVDGDAYLVVYTRPKKATKRAKRCNDTTTEEKGPQNEVQAHRCKDCPECAVIFDSEGIHGHVPDGNSKTCQSCERTQGSGRMKFENCKIPHIERSGSYLSFTMEFDVESTEDKTKLLDLTRDYYEFNLNVEIAEVRKIGQYYKGVDE